MRTKKNNKKPFHTVKKHPLLRAKTIRQWGYKRPKELHIIPTLKIYYRPQTTDEKVIEEVLEGNEYQKKKIGFIFEETDVWLDLGANIGTFALFVLSVGSSVICVEPEPYNISILKKNLHSNFTSDNYTILQCGVSTNNGTMPLYLCKGSYNKYRHSMLIHKGRQAIDVNVIAFDELLKYTCGKSKQVVNAVKMDIEGMEIELLEKYAKQMKHLKKLVFEYTFDADPSIPRFMRIMNLLKHSFDIVHFTRVNPKEKEYTYYPPCTTVFCLNN